MNSEKIRQLWEISKEQEQNFKHDLLEKYPSNIVEGTDIDELLKLIRGAEYRRGKEDGKEEAQKEFKIWLKDFNKLLEWEDNRETGLNKITRDKIKSLSEGKQ